MIKKLAMIDNLVENYEMYTDKYFLRAKSILQQEDINPIVRYRIFARKNIPSLRGVDEAIYFIQKIVGDKVKIYALKNGKSYTIGQPIMKLEGRIQDLIDIETVYLGILSGSLTGQVDIEEIRKSAGAIAAAAQDKKVFYFGARHFYPWLDSQIAGICCKAGFAGCSTDVGAMAWGDEGGGTIPHSLILAYGIDMREKGIAGNPTVEATKAFDKYMDRAIPRVALIDTFNEESRDSVETGRGLSNLSGVRIDTCGENRTKVSSPIEVIKLGNLGNKYLFGNGVTISGVWGLRVDLDLSILRNVKIVVSSGFNSRKVSAFMRADAVYQYMYGKPLFDSIGTGSLVKDAVMATSDIVAYFDEAIKKWIPYAKTGRAERLES